jgi:pilus assembly protein CpaB
MGRLRGYLWLVAGVVVAILAGAVAFVTISRATTEDIGNQIIAAPTEGVVVAVRAVDVQTPLTAEDVEVKEMPVEAVPDGAVSEVDQVVGKISLTDLYPDEVILSQRLVDPNVIATDGRTALVLTDGSVLMAFPAEDLMSKVGVLKPGDHVDFLYTYNLPVNRDTDVFSRSDEETVVAVEGSEDASMEKVTFDLLQNVTIAALVGGGSEEDSKPKALLLALSPQDALVLKYMKDTGANLDLVLRAPGDEGRFSTEPVDLDYVINGYILSDEGGR